MARALDADEFHPAGMRLRERADLIVTVDHGLAGLAPRQQGLDLGPHGDLAAGCIPHAKHATAAHHPDADRDTVVDAEPAVHGEAGVDDRRRTLTRRRWLRG